MGWRFGGQPETECVRRVRLRKRVHWKSEFNAEVAESAEKNNLFVAEPAVEDGLIGVDAAVAQKRPVAACFFALSRVALHHQDFFLVVPSLLGDLSEGVRDGKICPKIHTNIPILGFS